MMTLAERGRLGNAVTTARARERADRLLTLLEMGEPLKRAAYEAGMSYRSARRWRSRYRRGEV